MAIEIVDLPIKIVIFHSYVSLSDGNSPLMISALMASEDRLQLVATRPKFQLAVAQKLSTQH